jgi:hypothetical protein
MRSGDGFPSTRGAASASEINVIRVLENGPLAVRAELRIAGRSADAVPRVSLPFGYAGEWCDRIGRAHESADE